MSSLHFTYSWQDTVWSIIDPNIVGTNCKNDLVVDWKKNIFIYFSQNRVRLKVKIVARLDFLIDGFMESELMIENVF